jgi:tripartite-type tricarboxylate transporter receptor subunit TctC
MKKYLVSAIAAFALALIGAGPASAEYPDHLIKIVVPYPPAGPADVAARLVTQPLSSKLGQRVIVENQPGAGGRTGAKAVAQASPDGYTLLLGGTNPNAIVQSLYRNVDFEPLKDFAGVALIGFDTNALVVNPAVPAKSLPELIQYAKENPGKVASGATVGIGPHVCLELFRVRTGTNIIFIPYKGAAPAVADLLGGQIQIGMTSKAVLLPLIREGRLRALAVTAETRWPELPDVPTLRESGFDGIPAYLWFGLLAPVRTPRAVIEKLNGAVNEGLRSPELQASIAKLGLETRSMTAAGFSAKLDEEARNWEAAVKESGVKID